MSTRIIDPSAVYEPPRTAGYGGFLHDLRFSPDAALRSGFPLNEARYADAKILVARRNFRDRLFSGGGGLRYGTTAFGA
jgi:3-isopropylmalate dehydratase small subunit